jgi:hypothetical protein
MKAMSKRAAPNLPGREKIVRCGSGHLYRTVWVPFVSFKAVVRRGGHRGPANRGFLNPIQNVGNHAWDAEIISETACF